MIGLREYEQSQIWTIDDISLSFLQESNDRIPPILYGNARPMHETDDQKMMRKESIKNVTVVSKSGIVFKGFKGRAMSYEQTETLCRSRGARIPWFEMIPNQFSGPVWIE